MKNFFDVIVIGGGHAGTEAAASSSRVGASTLLITSKKSTIGQMSCNPAIGGLGKGHLVKEIDALGGIMGQAIDKSGIHFKVLNQSRGPAVQGPRAQADRDLYKKEIQQQLFSIDRLVVYEETVLKFDISNKNCLNIYISNGSKLSCKALVLTSGTFLKGLIHIGKNKISAGRIGEPSVDELSESLKKLNLSLGRLKTGTPPRIYKDSINWKGLQKQKGDKIPQMFSFLNEDVFVKQIDCYLTKTSAKTHEIIRDHINLSPLYNGSIDGVGPRYCPSIEDKIIKFPDKKSHQIFLEPEGLTSDLIYPNGISTSLPEKIQDQIVASIPGLESSKIAQYGYAIEYDFVDPRSLLRTLEVKSFPGLFLAGQINGTTGYEEAAGQGLIAGVNAAIRSFGEEPDFILLRNTSYIGVMIDDLVTKGVKEPYRMFTSRAEYRLSLRSDNADQRLTDIGIKFGLIDKRRKNLWMEKKEKISFIKKTLLNHNISNKTITKQGLRPPRDGKKRNLFQTIGLPEYKNLKISKICPELNNIEKKLLEQVIVDSRYLGYIKRQEEEIMSFEKDEKIKIPKNINFNKIGGLSKEVVEKLNLVKPETLGQASRVAGITPAAMVSVLRYLRRNAA